MTATFLLPQDLNLTCRWCGAPATTMIEGTPLWGCGRCAAEYRHPVYLRKARAQTG